MIKRRPKKWSCNNSPVNASEYNMLMVHFSLMQFIKRRKEVKSISLKKNWKKYFSKILGISILDEGKIFIDDTLKNNMDDYYITILHELFHYFFRDIDGDTENDEIIEQRCDTSAINMLEWYKKNYKEFLEFKEYIDRIKTYKFSEQEFLELKEFIRK